MLSYVLRVPVYAPWVPVTSWSLYRYRYQQNFLRASSEHSLSGMSRVLLVQVLDTVHCTSYRVRRVLSLMTSHKSIQYTMAPRLMSWFAISDKISIPLNEISLEVVPSTGVLLQKGTVEEVKCIGPQHRMQYTSIHRNPNLEMRTPCHESRFACHDHHLVRCSHLHATNKK